MAVRRSIRSAEGCGSSCKTLEEHTYRLLFKSNHLPIKSFHTFYTFTIHYWVVGHQQQLFGFSELAPSSTSPFGEGAAAMFPLVRILWTKMATASEMPGCVRSLADVSTQPIISDACEIEEQFQNWELPLVMAHCIIASWAGMSACIGKSHLFCMTMIGNWPPLVTKSFFQSRIFENERGKVWSKTMMAPEASR